MKRGDVLLLIAALLVVTGVGLVSVPAALVVAGVGVGASWWWFVDEPGGEA
jgi:hypothetical protein